MILARTASLKKDDLGIVMKMVFSGNQVATDVS